MNTHTIQAEHRIQGIYNDLSTHKELEIEREVLLQHNKTANLEEAVTDLLNRLLPVMSPLEGVVDADLPAAGNNPTTPLGKQLRDTSLRIDSLTEQVRVALQRLEIS